MRAERPHFLSLDGMRGIAALAVGYLHAAIYFKLDFVPHHASLAVDFFFVLSGFVIAFAYDRQFAAGLTFRAFAIKRLIRLYPLIFVGVLLGSCVTLAQSFIGDTDFKTALALSVAALFMFPLGTFLGMQPYPVNNPIWSLFFEFGANWVYGVAGKRGAPPGRWQAGLLLAISAILLLGVIRHYGTIERVGFSGKLSLFLGLIRVCYPFLAGVLIYRWRFVVDRFGRQDWVLGVLLSGLFLCPFLQDSWIYDSVSILVLFPLVVMMGLCPTSDRKANYAWKTLGELSYPFYLIHQPVVRACSLYFATHHPTGAPPSVLAGVSVAVAAIAALILFNIYDRPVRRWMTARIRA